MRGQWDALYQSCGQYDTSYILQTVGWVKKRRLKCWMFLKKEDMDPLIYSCIYVNIPFGFWSLYVKLLDRRVMGNSHYTGLCLEKDGTQAFNRHCTRWIIFINVKFCFFEWYFWLSVLAFRVLGGLMMLSLRALLYYFYHLLYDCVLIIACSSLAI